MICCNSDHLSDGYAKAREGMSMIRRIDLPAGQVLYRFMPGRAFSKVAIDASAQQELPGTHCSSSCQNFPFAFFHSVRGGMVSMVSQCSAILPFATLKRS